jgi:hypothetical protein
LRQGLVRAPTDVSQEPFYFRPTAPLTVEKGRDSVRK